jgi:hypothetical protein
MLRTEIVFRGRSFSFILADGFAGGRREHVIRMPGSGRIHILWILRSLIAVIIKRIKPVLDTLGRSAYVYFGIVVLVSSEFANWTCRGLRSRATVMCFGI